MKTLGTVVIKNSKCSGYETTKGLVSRGARVYMACRDIKRAEQAKGDIEKVPMQKPQQNRLLPYSKF